MTALAMDPSTLGFVQVVTSSHQHTDHLDADTLKPMIQANPDLQMVIPASMETLLPIAWGNRRRLVSWS